MVQRRADVRGLVALPLHGTARRPGRVGLLGLVQRTEFAGRTIDLSAGGLHAQLDPPAPSDDAHEFYLELDGAGPRAVGAVQQAVALRSGLLRARFLVIAPSDREYLVHRVFAAQRAELADRRRPRP